MYKDVFHSDFYALDVDGVDVFLGYPQMDPTGIVNINVQKKFMKLWQKKKKITLQDLSLTTIKEPKVEE